METFRLVVLTGLSVILMAIIFGVLAGGLWTLLDGMAGGKAKRGPSEEEERLRAALHSIAGHSTPGSRASPAALVKVFHQIAMDALNYSHRTAQNDE